MFARLLIATCVLAVTALASDTHEIRLLRPMKAGDRFDLSAKVAYDDAVTTSLEGREIESSNTIAACRLSGVLTVSAVTKKGLPTEIRLKIGSVECVVDGKPAEFFRPGDELRLRRGEPDNDTEVNGEPADEVQAQIIDSLLSVTAENEVTDEDIFGTGDKVAVGAEWPVNAKAAVKALDQNGVSGLKPDGVKGHATLVSLGEFQSQPAMSLRMVAEIEGQSVRLPNFPENVKGRRFHSEYAVEMTLPVDPMSTAGRVKGMVKMEVDAAGTSELDGRTVDVSVKINRRVASELNATPAR